MTGQSGGESASRSVGGIRALPVSLEKFRLQPPPGGKAQQVDRLVKVASGYNDISGPQRVQTSSGLPHFIHIRNCDTSQRCGFVKIWGDQLRQGKQLFNQKTGSGGIQQVLP